MFECAINERVQNKNTLCARARVVCSVDARVQYAFACASASASAMCNMRVRVVLNASIVLVFASTPGTGWVGAVGHDYGRYAQCIVLVGMYVCERLGWGVGGYW